MQRTRSKFALLATAALTLALLAFIAWQWSANSTDANFTAASPSAPAPIARASVEPETLAPLVAANATPAADAQRVEVSDDLFDKQHFATVILKGRIESSCNDLARARVEVRPAWKNSGINEKRNVFRHLTAQAQADGSFEFDVTALIQDSKRGRTAVELAVSVTHPALADATENVDVPDENRLLRERRIELTTIVRMPFGSATLAGEVRTAEGAQPSIKIAAFQTYDQKNLVNTADMVTAVVVDGRFRMQVHADVEYVIVAIADGYRPGTTRGRAGLGKVVDLPLLVLARGEKIRGRVLPESPTSGAGATISAQLADPFTSVAVDGGVLAWCGEDFEWGPRVTNANGDGDYEFAQLGPRAYKLSVSGIRGSYLTRAPSLDVVAPSLSANFSIGSACEVHLAFFQEGKPALVYFAVQQERPDRGHSSTSQNGGTDGRATLFVDAGTPTNIAFMDHLGERTLAIPNCTGGVVELRVDL